MSEAQTREPTSTKVINGVAGLPICAAGAAMLFALNYMGGDEDLRTLWRLGALAVVALGALVEIVGIVLVGKYSTPRIDPMRGEETLDRRNPSNAPAYFWMVLGAFLFAPALAILPFIEASYEAVGIAAFWVAAATIVYLRGTVVFWRNQHTVYYATNFRLVRMYQFLRVDTLSMPIEGINAVHVASSFAERTTRRGDVSVYAGRRAMRMRGIDNPVGMAATILEQLRRRRSLVRYG